ncbi:hypothetical protein Taro_036755 [Colocasia esculenta]|uniref:Uncharacterized protein n=1 Tax=Colocasia esculenta TaxID=4460 RepID=A0A843WH87_COLES|nr:hypothetical protein [Colocasia esculenta]
MPIVVTSPVGCPRFSMSQAVNSGLCPGTCAISSSLRLSYLYLICSVLREFPTEPVTSEVHTYSLQVRARKRFPYRRPVQSCVAAELGQHLKQSSSSTLVVPVEPEMADRRDWGGGGDETEETTQRVIERIWESLTDIRMRMDQQALVPPVAVSPGVGGVVPVAPVPPPLGVEVPLVAPVPPPPPMQTTFAGRVESAITWTEFLGAFNDTFFPMQVQQAKREQFRTLQQGLRPELQTAVIPLLCRTVEEAAQRAATLERAVRTCLASKAGSGNFRLPQQSAGVVDAYRGYLSSWVPQVLLTSEAHTYSPQVRERRRFPYRCPVQSYVAAELGQHLHQSSSSTLVVPVVPRAFLNIRKLMDFLAKYSKSSGQQINASKSCFMISQKASAQAVHRIKLLTGFKRQNGPLPYLGVPLRTGRTQAADFQPLIEKLNRRLATWKPRLLS